MTQQQHGPLYMGQCERTISQMSIIWHHLKGFACIFLVFTLIFHRRSWSSEVRLTRSRSHINEQRSWERELIPLIPSLCGFPMWHWLLNPNSVWTGSWQCQVLTHSQRRDALGPDVFYPVIIPVSPQKENAHGNAKEARKVTYWI